MRASYVEDGVVSNNEATLLVELLGGRSFAEFGHEGHVLLVDLVVVGSFVAVAALAVAGTVGAAVASDVAGAAAVGANDGVGHVGLVGALPGLVRRGAAVGAARSELALAERAVQHGQLAQLHLAQIVLVLGHLCVNDSMLMHVPLQPKCRFSHQ